MDIKHIERKAQEAAAILKALSNSRRILIVCALHEQERSVGELEKIVGLSQSSLSQHLARLRRDGLVLTRREAQTIYYSLNQPRTSGILEYLYAVVCKGVTSSS
jgi:DNA-binding transcriptional ArsR family regulator